MATTAKGIATDALARHLHAAIERVRDDMEKVEFWADAMTSFSEPVPEYRPDDMTVWLPSEQATKISSARHGTSATRGRSERSRGASKRR